MIEEQKGAYEAENLLEELGFDSLPINPVDVANSIDHEGFRVVMEYKDFDSDSILGKAEGNSKGALIYINNSIPDAGRLNFTAAHEIGHVCLHIMPQKKLSFECGFKELSNPYDDPIEKEANGFASGLLMPNYMIKQYSNCDVNWHDINQIHELCGSSLEATYRRFTNIDKMPCAMVIHQHGKFKRYVASSDFEFYILNHSLTADQKSSAIDVKEEGYPSDFDVVVASDWVNTFSNGQTLETIYSSTVLLNEGITYTLLTYDDDCFKNEEY